MNLIQFDWQTIVAILIVLVAVVVFARKTWKSIFSAGSAGCGTSCNNCPASSNASSNAIKVTKLVQLDSRPRE